MRCRQPLKSASVQFYYSLPILPVITIEKDALGQVVSGKRRWPDGSYVAGQQFEHVYDEIGNRITSSRGGNSTGASQR